MSDDTKTESASFQFSQAMRQSCQLFGAQQASEWFQKRNRGERAPSISQVITQPELSGLLAGAVLAQIAPITQEIFTLGQKLSKANANGLMLRTEALRLEHERAAMEEALGEVIRIGTGKGSARQCADVAMRVLSLIQQRRVKGAANDVPPGSAA